MKRYAILASTALILVGLFTGCSGYGYNEYDYNDGYYNRYGNVSTTNNGRVNGTNDDLNRNIPSYNYNRPANDTTRSNAYNSSSYAGNTANSGTQKTTTVNRSR